MYTNKTKRKIYNSINSSEISINDPRVRIVHDNRDIKLYDFIPFIQFEIRVFSILMKKQYPKDTI